MTNASAEEKTAFAVLYGAVAPDKRIELGQRYVKAKDAAPTHPHTHPHPRAPDGRAGPR